MTILYLIKTGSFRPGSISMESIHRYTRTSRQWLAQGMASQAREKAVTDSIRDQVSTHRREKDRRAGSRNLYYTLNMGGQFNLGVNKFEQLMSKNELTLKPLRTRIITTASNTRSRNYEDHANGLEINSINRLIVGDLTYVYLNRTSPYYLFCLTDVYSARLLGFCLHDRMRAIEAAQALSMCIKLRGKRQLNGCIHHTDGGSQYFSDLYLSMLNSCNMIVSCAKSCLQNGYAEQRNGLIKNHLIPTIEQTRLDKVTKELKEMFYFYNHHRKQEALGWRSPVEYEAFIAQSTNTIPMKLYKYEPA